MTASSMQSARQLELDADATRRRLASTLDNLADNLTPGRLLDEVIGYSREGGASFMKGLGNAASTNPLPTLLLGVGAAMLLSGKGRLDSVPRNFGDLFSRSNGHARASGTESRANGGSRGSMLRDAGNALGDAAESAGSGVTAAAASVSAVASSAVDRVAETATSAAGAVRDAAGEVGAFATSAAAAAGDEAGRLGDHARRMTHDLRDRASRLAEEQTLVVAIAGIALGAILAAALPRTAVEDDLMGDASDTIKKAAGDVASEQITNISSEASKVAEDLGGAIAERGGSAKAVVDVVRDATERVVGAAGAGLNGEDRTNSSRR